ncbi:MAG TPA: citrate/2-methylcitrate synthase [Methylomirabilota bacterium]|jgi:citrate synthase|nr:citrate/2-methylcitrate synthase [Methylomirabilota bacterium]
MTGWKAGLEDVIAARSAICAIDGEAGRLYYRGYEIGELVETASFEAVTHLLWFGDLPSPSEAAGFTARLQAARGLPASVLALLRGLPRDSHPLDVVRTAISLAATTDPDVRAGTPEANLDKACRLMNLVPETVAAWQRLRRGLEPVPATGGGSHAAQFLYLLEGREPSPELARVLDVILTLHADHELNASTFAARVAVATLADLHAAVVAALATLKGPRHGGANEDVLAMLLEIEDPARADAFVAARLDARAGMSRSQRADPRARVPGFGHRVYRVDDARARVLRGMARTMADATGTPRLFAVAERVHEAMRARTSLPVNVDFYSAVVYHALAIEPEFCTSIFAAGRIAGWCAHALEQYADNRLIRPRADYVGPAPRPLAAATSARL